MDLRPRRRGLLAVLLALAPAGWAAAPALADDCPGAEPACPYTAASAIGQRGGGTLRFPQTVAVGPDGSVYVGDQLSHAVQVFNADGSFQREVGVAGSRPGELGAVGALALAGDGTLLVADGRDRIDRFDAAGNLIGSWGGSGTALGQLRFGAGGGHDAPAGGGLAASGDTVFVSDSLNNRIQAFTLDGRSATEVVPPGQLSYPRGLAVLGNRLVVADDKNHRLVVYDTGGHLLRTIAGGPGAGPNQLNNPFGVAIDSQGRVFVADDLNHRVVRFSMAPKYLYRARWGSYGTGPGQLAYPRGIATDRAGLVYLANTGDDRIDVFDLSGRLIRSFGSSGRGPSGFTGPAGVGVDAAGIRAVADSYNGRVRLLNPDGSPAAIWGSPNPGPTILPDPVAVAFDAAGQAYVLDQRRARIVVFDRATGLPARTIGSLGTGPGQLLEPTALAIDAGGTIVVADAGNRRIARFTTGGDYLGSITDAGSLRGIAVTPDGARIAVSDTASWITVFAPDGQQLARFGGVGRKLGKLAAPAQLAFDGAGNLWVADRGNNRVQQFGPQGERLQTFGVRGTGAGEFIHPTGVAVSCNGTLTVTDTDNHRVQQFALAAPAGGPACAALPPVGTPPPPKAPTLPEPLGPQVTLKVLRTEGIVRTRSLPLMASCDTGCTISATATVSQRAKPKKGKRVSVKLTARQAQLAAASPRLLRLTLSRAAAARVQRGLGRTLRGLTIDIQLTATAPAGAPTVVTRHLFATL